MKLNQNEAPWDWPEALKDQALEAIRNVAFHRYAPLEGTELVPALARRWNQPAEGVLLGNGSNELLLALFLSALGSRRTLLTPEPTFGLYGLLAGVAGAPIRRVPLEGGTAYDPKVWIDTIRRVKPYLVLLCSPNNPTGAAFPLEALPELLAEAPGLVAVDEAYGEFLGESAAKYLPEASNLVVLRTFSKALASAGLRLGYLMGAPEVVRQIRKGLLPHAVSAVTAALGAVALENEGVFLERAAEIVWERDRLFSRLQGLSGLRVYPSRANFLLVRFSRNQARDIFRSLKERGVLVRDVSGQPLLEHCLRFTVGTREENDALLHALEDSLSQPGMSDSNTETTETTEKR